VKLLITFFITFHTIAYEKFHMNYDEVIITPRPLLYLTGTKNFYTDYNKNERQHFKYDRILLSFYRMSFSAEYKLSNNNSRLYYIPQGTRFRVIGSIQIKLSDRGKLVDIIILEDEEGERYEISKISFESYIQNKKLEYFDINAKNTIAKLMMELNDKSIYVEKHCEHYKSTRDKKILEFKSFINAYNLKENEIQIDKLERSIQNGFCFNVKYYTLSAILNKRNFGGSVLKK
tara:strand:+ start:73449 stop:74144 length:696 start_codon:yes stop_codon:yes gene_type:complete